jgi:hypothetical protein
VWLYQERDYTLDDCRCVRALLLVAVAELLECLTCRCVRAVLLVKWLSCLSAVTVYGAVIGAIAACWVLNGIAVVYRSRGIAAGC